MDERKNDTVCIKICIVNFAKKEQKFRQQYISILVHATVNYIATKQYNIIQSTFICSLCITGTKYTVTQYDMVNVKAVNIYCTWPLILIFIIIIITVRLFLLLTSQELCVQLESQEKADLVELSSESVCRVITTFNNNRACHHNISETLKFHQIYCVTIKMITFLFF